MKIKWENTPPLILLIVVGYFMWPISASRYKHDKCVYIEAERSLYSQGGFGWIPRYRYNAIVEFCSKFDKETL